MRKLKKRLSQFLAVTLITSMLAQPGLTAFASTSPRNLGSPERLAVSERKDVATGSDVVREEGMPEDKKNPFDVDEEEEKRSATRSDAIKRAGAKRQLEDGELNEPGNGDIAALSMLPLMEVRAYLFLNDYSDEQIKAMPIETILELLVDGWGDPIEIPEDAKIVWAYFKDEDGDIKEDEYHVIERGETVDLSEARNENSMYFQMELIVGSGNQLDADSIRYIVNVYISDTIEDNLYFYLWDSNDSSVSIREIAYRHSTKLEDIEIPITSVSIVPDSYDSEEDYSWLVYSSSDAVGMPGNIIQGINLPMKDFVDNYQNGKSIEDIVDISMLNQEAVNYEDKYEEIHRKQRDSEEDLDIDDIRCIVYYNPETGDIIGYHGLEVNVCPEIERISGNLFSYEDGQMKNVTEKISCSSVGDLDWEIKLHSESNGVVARYSNDSYDYFLKEGYSSDAEYYYVIDAGQPIKKIVEGSFNTMQEAEEAGAEDITSQLLPVETDQMPYGYLISDHSRRFTVLFDDGIVMKYYLYISESTTSKYANVKYDEAPISGKEDPYFRVTGAMGYESSKRYVVKNSSYGRTLDTLYGYGYQTILLNDENVDLTALKPVFYKPDNVKVHVGEEQKSGISEQDFSNGPVFYAAHIDDKLKNYQVTFVKKENGAKLFVNGPEEREIFLDEYFENRHDILIANVGDAELTGLNVELLDAVHVRLDDYWTVGGEKNDSLAAFTNAYSSGSYHELANLAKIRLLPDGEGEVKGTLKISADGQDDVYIKLTGHAGNPRIITESLSEAVKYVPYSYVVATNNMHDWNKVTFSIKSGKLPNGLQLYPDTGEIYGVPLETGEFPITVEAKYSRKEYTPSTVELVLTIKENTNENVYTSSDEGYAIQEHIGTETGEGTHEYVLRSFGDQTFVSSGQYDEFVDFWMNGEKLVDGVDYTKESGSTRITVKSQTFKDKAKNGSNTIAAEFRVDGDKSKELKRTAQNFTMNVSHTNNNQLGDNSNPGGGSSSSNNDAGNKGTSNNNISQNSNPIDPNRDITRYNDDSWVKDDIGWRCKMPDGNWITNTWFRLPYQGTVEWYYFNEQGYMVTGLLAHNGLLYYLNPISDGTQGKMITGWKMIDGKWYYFKEIDDGTMGAMMSDIWIGEYYVNSQGIWEE